MPIEASGNSFILKSAENIKHSNTQPCTQNVRPNTVNNVDKFISTKDDDKSSKKGIFSSLALGVAMAGLFFLPDFLLRKHIVKSENLFDKLLKVNLLIGQEVTSRKQVGLKNGNIKLTFENEKDLCKDIETIILEGSKIKQRIVCRKKKLPNGKYIVQEMKSYKGDNLVNNEEFTQKGSSNLVKHFKRIQIDRGEYKELTKGKQKRQIAKSHYTTQGQPILRSIETDTHKENTAFLYSGDECVGVDKQVISKNDDSEYHVLTLPNKGIFGRKYNPETDGHQFDESLMSKLLNNF